MSLSSHADTSPHALHFCRVWGSHHGGSLYSQAILDELTRLGWRVTVFAERFDQPVDRAIRLTAFFQRHPRHWPRKLIELFQIFRLALRVSTSQIIVQGDLPRLSYLLLQWILPLIFIRQDAILCCPANNRFLPRTNSICHRRFGFSCLAHHRRENCLGQLSLPTQLGRVLFRLRDRWLLSGLQHFVAN
ncbi:MAG TPA: hypothetical protein VL793_03080, partial [Patescibacteria group bacterium]|nr:hypothetical protein [Patescibacteria group bacterium]